MRSATKLANYTDQLVRHYNINSVDSSAYLNRAALVGCNNEKLSQDYANQLYTFGKTNFPCSSSVAIILVSGCLPSNAAAASLVTLSSPMDRIMLYLFFYRCIYARV
jgi:hypothetical protein